MNRVDKFVRNSILRYPSLFENRTQVLHHTLCVIGNGYKWSDAGNIVSDGYWNRIKTPVFDKDQYLDSFFNRLDYDLSEEQKNLLRTVISQELSQEADELQEIVDTVDTRMYERAEIVDFYPQSDYALLLKMPNNVSKSWREACDEMRELAIKAGWTFE